MGEGVRHDISQSPAISGRCNLSTYYLPNPSSALSGTSHVRNAGRRGRRTYSHFWPAGRLSIGRKALLLRARRLAGAILRCDAGAETRTFRYRAAELLWHRQSRSEEHTSELQSLMRISFAVFCLKKK